MGTIYCMTVRQLHPATNIGNAAFIAGNYHFCAAGQRLTVFASGAAGLPSSFLRKDNFACAILSNCAADSAQHPNPIIVSRIQCMVVGEQKLDDEPEDD